MSGKDVRTATVDSSDSIKLGFPYRGENRGHLMVRKHPQHGLDVMFRVDQGQIMCSDYAGCSVMVRFDAAPPVRMHGVGSADHDPSVIFLRDAAGFVARAKKAKTLLVQASYYQNGSQVLTFETPEGLDWR